MDKLLGREAPATPINEKNAIQAQFRKFALDNFDYVEVETTHIDESMRDVVEKTCEELQTHLSNKIASLDELIHGRSTLLASLEDALYRIKSYTERMNAVEKLNDEDGFLTYIRPDLDHGRKIHQEAKLALKDGERTLKFLMEEITKKKAKIIADDLVPDSLKSGKPIQGEFDEEGTKMSTELGGMLKKVQDIAQANFRTRRAASSAGTATGIDATSFKKLFNDFNAFDRDWFFRYFVLFNLLKDELVRTKTILNQRILLFDGLLEDLQASYEQIINLINLKNKRLQTFSGKIKEVINVVPSRISYPLSADWSAQRKIIGLLAENREEVSKSLKLFLVDLTNQRDKIPKFFATLWEFLLMKNEELIKEIRRLLVISTKIEEILSYFGLTLEPRVQETTEQVENHKSRLNELFAQRLREEEMDEMVKETRAIYSDLHELSFAAITWKRELDELFILKSIDFLPGGIAQLAKSYSDSLQRVGIERVKELQKLILDTIASKKKVVSTLRVVENYEDSKGKIQQFKQDCDMHCGLKVGVRQDEERHKLEEQGRTLLDSVIETRTRFQNDISTRKVDADVFQAKLRELSIAITELEQRMNNLEFERGLNQVGSILSTRFAKNLDGIPGQISLEKGIITEIQLENLTTGSAELRQLGDILEPFTKKAGILKNLLEEGKKTMKIIYEDLRVFDDFLGVINKFVESQVPRRVQYSDPSQLDKLQNQIRESASFLNAEIKGKCLALLQRLYNSLFGVEYTIQKVYEPFAKLNAEFILRIETTFTGTIADVLRMTLDHYTAFATFVKENDLSKRMNIETTGSYDSDQLSGTTLVGRMIEMVRIYHASAYMMDALNPEIMKACTTPTKLMEIIHVFQKCIYIFYCVVIPQSHLHKSKVEFIQNYEKYVKFFEKNFIVRALHDLIKLANALNTAKYGRRNPRTAIAFLEDIKKYLRAKAKPQTGLDEYYYEEHFGKAKNAFKLIYNQIIEEIEEIWFLCDDTVTDLVDLEQDAPIDHDTLDRFFTNADTIGEKIRLFSRFFNDFVEYYRKIC